MLIEYLKLVDRVEGKTHLLGDLNKAGKPNATARKILLDLTEFEKYGNVAFFGVHPLARESAGIIYCRCF